MIKLFGYFFKSSLKLILVSWKKQNRALTTPLCRETKLTFAIAINSPLQSSPSFQEEVEEETILKTVTTEEQFKEHYEIH